MKITLFAIAVLLLLNAGCAEIETQHVADEINPSSKTNLTLKERLSGPIAGGHQGDLFSLKFNTIAAFELARRAGVDVVEMDLHLSKDGIPVVYHDHNLSRWTMCHGRVGELTYAELGRCKFKLSNEKIPRFEDVLMWSHGRVVVNAEFKEIAPIDPAVLLVAKYNAYEWVYFQVKSDEQYVHLRSLDTKVNILLVANDRADLEHIISFHDEHVLLIELAEDSDTPENIEYVHANGKIATKDAFDFDPFLEIFGAKCNKIFKRNIDVAISNRPYGCVAQKQKFLRDKSVQ